IADWGREGAPLAIGGDLGITARITEVVEVPGSAMVGPYYRVTAQVSGMAARGTPAQSTSLVEVVYRVVPGDGSGCRAGPRERAGARGGLGPLRHRARARGADADRLILRRDGAAPRHRGAGGGGFHPGSARGADARLPH